MACLPSSPPSATRTMTGCGDRASSAIVSSLSFSLVADCFFLSHLFSVFRRASFGGGREGGGEGVSKERKESVRARRRRILASSFSRVETVFFLSLPPSRAARRRRRWLGMLHALPRAPIPVEVLISLLRETLDAAYSRSSVRTVRKRWGTLRLGSRFPAPEHLRRAVVAGARERPPPPPSSLFGRLDLATRCFSRRHDAVARADVTRTLSWG